MEGVVGSIPAVPTNNFKGQMDKINSSDMLNHSCEHILAAAVLKLFPSAKVAMGPKDHSEGFYYDFDVERAFIESDLKKIEEVMIDLIKSNVKFEKKLISKEEAQKLFTSLKQDYKLKILDFIDAKEVSIYKCGDFIDLCRGPHLPQAGLIKAFKLLGVSGSYWRASADNKMLQRISGIAFLSKKELEDYFFKQEEAKKRDHRKLGPKHELFFHAHEEVGPGLALWLPNGGRIRSIIEDFSKKRHFNAGYDFVYSPHIAKSDLWKISGHLDFYKESMFAPMKVEEKEYILKPMNCPFHVMMYKFRPRSYRELPMRLAEFGTVYRYELAGVLHGLMRVRGFTQDDAHIFCRWDQLDTELDRVVVFVLDMLRAFGFSDFEVNISTRPKKFVGEESLWDIAQNSLIKAIERNKLMYIIDEGGGAFYGPKIDIKLKDCLGRLWQCSTIQLDFNNPKRFDLSFINSQGQKEEPVMIHRALFGSIERFIAILVEHYAQAFPAWLAPEQVRILTVADRHNDHGDFLVGELKKADIRASCDKNHEKLGAKIRQAQIDKVPTMVIIGDKEVMENGGTLRLRSEEDKGFFKTSDLIEALKQICKQPA